MKSSTLTALGALVLAVSASAHIGAANPQPGSLRQGAPTRHRLRVPARRAPVERVLTASQVTLKQSVVIERESEHRYQLHLPAGCSRVVAIGDGSVRDLALEVRGPRTMRMRQDLTHSAIESLSVCGTSPANYEVIVAAKGSEGRPAIELRVREPG